MFSNYKANSINMRKPLQKYTETDFLINWIAEIDDLICEINHKGFFTYVNRAFVEKGGYTLEELQQLPFKTFLPEESFETLETFYNKQLNNQQQVSYLEFPIITKNGRECWIGAKLTMRFQDEKMERAFCIARDVTVQRQTKEELIAAKETAVKASLAKAQFLSSMSHELRTPMNAVIGMTHLLQQENPRADQMENLKTLKFSAESLLSLINDILDFSKIEAGKIDFEEVEFSLNYIASSIIHAQESRAKDKGISLRMEYDKQIPAFIIGDPVRLSQILNNLISNALKFTNEGEVVMKILQQKESDRLVTINFSIKDTGIGIPADKLEHIFENFTQASSSTTRNYGGTGLGLAITRQLLELQNSSIQVKSTINKGSVFYFTLSFGKGEKASIGLKKEHNQKSGFPSLNGMKVLLVEDNKINQIVARKFLTKWDIAIDIADNGQIALDLLEENKYDLVLMDLQMPVMDGFEATKVIRSLKKFDDLPIIALTASAVLEIQDAAMDAGMNDFVTKPFNPQNLYNKIQQYEQKIEITG